MRETLIVTAPAPRQTIIVPAAVRETIIVNTGVRGLRGFPGADGTGGGGSSNTYIQQTDPAIATPYIWFKTDVDGHVIDILKGGA